MSEKMSKNFNGLSGQKNDVGDFVTCDLKLPAKKNRCSTAKHTLWVDFNRVRVDGRSRLAKTMKFLRRELQKHLGGFPTIGEAILIDRIVSKVIKCQLYEAGFFSSDDRQGSRDHYLALANSLRLDLQTLGIKKRGGEGLDLDKYLKLKEKDEHHRINS
jgi:hypothetical protein